VQVEQSVCRESFLALALALAFNLQLFVVARHQLIAYLVERGRPVILEGEFDSAPTELGGDEVELPLLIGGDGERDEEVGVEAYGDLFAGKANHRGLKLPHHQVAHVGLDALRVVDLAFPTHLLVRFYLLSRLESLLLLH
jgi:hypothetical protein